VIAQQRVAYALAQQFIIFDQQNAHATTPVFSFDASIPDSSAQATRSVKCGSSRQHD
jgi:hypothetical protein